MFNTTIGAGDSGRPGFLRPETAQRDVHLVQRPASPFPRTAPLRRHAVGKGYRNEIALQQGMIRLREFNMAELEYFIDQEAPFSDDLTPDDHPLTLIHLTGVNPFK